MRLHELSVTAFGPFSHTVHVDFDELSAGGLFLLTGDTGAGKTSVLDAVCFALYGEVPGERHGARHLRSDHADPGAEPRVVLRAGLRGREFRFTRSPAWDRPKRRGAGTTRVQAHVVVEERREGEWCALTNRLDESGQLVTDLLGMTCAQFTQVAMLPQGHFQAFLQASSADRHAVLQRLFRTRRFEQVERWLVERRLDLRRRSETWHDQVAGVVHRIQEAAAADLPGDPQDLEPLADDVLGSWAGGLADRARADADSLGAQLRDATTHRERARATHEHGNRTAEARARGERARVTLGELEASRDVEAELVTDLERHRRASVVRPTTLRAEQAEEAVARATSAATDRVAAAAALLGVSSAVVTRDLLTEVASRTGESRAVAESWLPRERALADERERLRLLAARLEQLDSRISTAQHQLGVVENARAGSLPAMAAARELSAHLEGRHRAVESAADGLAAARLAAALGEQLSERRAMLETATERAHDLREWHLDLRERRICGMAAELASSLAIGCSCPVCGSHEHPAPATATTRIGRADEEAARQQHEEADFERQAVKESVSAVESQLAVACEKCEDGDAARWQGLHDEAVARLDDSREAARRLEALEAEAVALGRSEAELSAAVAADQGARTARRQQLEEAEARCARLADELSDLLAAHPSAGSVAALVALQTETLGVLEAARERLSALEGAAAELAAAARAADDAASGAGFASLREALSAVLPGHEAAARSHRLDTRRATRAAATQVVEDPAVARALDEAVPDLPLLESAVRDAGHRRDAVHAASRQADSRRSRLEALRRELEDALLAWAPVRAEHALVAGLAALVEGKSVDNRLKMRLSAYVLSERLRQVVAAANERLGEMTDERYTLEQADEKGAGEQRGGLSLRVRDEWSGRQRDPATLSGGETFLVSLALALGLADTVSHEAGGTQLDTLFIDEGFGALDATTLDAVMNTLDSLRDGGRVVGLVSHVAELRSRVPTQLEVRKGRRGSTLSPTVTTS